MRFPFDRYSVDWRRQHHYYSHNSHTHHTSSIKMLPVLLRLTFHIWINACRLWVSSEQYISGSIHIHECVELNGNWAPATINKEQTNNNRLESGGSSEPHAYSPFYEKKQFRTTQNVEAFVCCFPSFSTPFGVSAVLKTLPWCVVPRCVALRQFSLACARFHFILFR